MDYTRLSMFRQPALEYAPYPLKLPNHHQALLDIISGDKDEFMKRKSIKWTSSNNKCFGNNPIIQRILNIHGDLKPSK